MEPELLFQEDDPRYFLDVSKTKVGPRCDPHVVPSRSCLPVLCTQDGQYLTINANSKTASEVRLPVVHSCITLWFTTAARGGEMGGDLSGAQSLARHGPLTLSLSVFLS